MIFKWKSINTYFKKIYRTLLTFYIVTRQDMRIIGVLRNIEMDVGSCKHHNKNYKACAILKDRLMCVSIEIPKKNL